MKVMKKLLLITMIIALSLLLTQSSILAYEGWSARITETTGLTADKASSAVTSVNNIAGTVITIARTICMGVAVTMLIVLAIKYMSAAPGDKATIKKSAVTYVVGAIVMFAASGILAIIEQFSKVLD